MSGFRKSRFSVTVPLEETFEGKKLAAVYQTLTRGFMIVPEDDWSGLEKNPSPDTATVDAFIKQGFLVKDGVDENTVFQNWRQQHVHDFNVLRSKNLVTRECNNRCRYCIVDAEARKMSRQTAKLVDDFYIKMIKDKNPRKVEDIYSGGEALLNSRVLLECATRRYYFCMGRGIEYSFFMITNGTLLTPEVISMLKEVGLSSIRVSIAGPQRVHDHLRPSKGGKGTYERIVRNLKAISGLIPIIVENQYDSASEDYKLIPEMLDDFRDRGLEISNVYFTPIIPKRGSPEYTKGLGDPRVYIEVMKEADRRGYPQFTEPPSNACLADYRGRIVFDTDGSIIPCGSLQGGEMAFGHVATGVDFVGESQILERSFEPRCLNECELLPTCMGGCRLQALGNGEDFSAVDCHYAALKLTLEEYILRKSRAALAGRT